MRHLVLVLLPALAACAANPPPVPLTGEAAAVARLAGSWAGEYSSEETGRAGSIVFRVRAGHAHGDVVMTPRGGDRPLQPFWPSRDLPDPRVTEVLTIEFVHAAGDSVVGRLTPYRDPDCDCPVWTAFTGVVRGDTIAGTYATIRTDLSRATGSWQVRRR